MPVGDKLGSSRGTWRGAVPRSIGWLRLPIGVKLKGIRSAILGGGGIELRSRVPLAASPMRDADASVIVP